MNELHLFSGSGGGMLGGMLLGHTPVCCVEIEKYCRENLLQRQRDGILPRFDIWDDIRTFDGKPWRGKVDIVSGGFPCQDISSAGTGKGIGGERSGLWGEMARVIGEVRPEFAFVENSPLLRTARARRVRLLKVVDSLFGRFRVCREIIVRMEPDLLRVLADLAEMGYDATWTVMGAHHVGAPHKRDRIWILAYSKSKRAGRDVERLRGLSERRSQGPQGMGGIEVVSDSARLQPGRQEQRTKRKRTRESGKSKSLDDSTSRRFEKSGNQLEAKGRTFEASGSGRRGWWELEPSIRRMDDELAAQLDIHGAASAGYLGRVASGVKNRVGRLKALGNGQVPLCYIRAWQRCIKELNARFQ